MIKKTAIIQPLCLALILSLGFCVAIIILVCWSVSLIGEKPVPLENCKKNEALLVLTDGTPVIKLLTSVGADENGEWQKKAANDPTMILEENQGLYTTTTYRTLDGKLINVKDKDRLRELTMQLGGTYRAKLKPDAKALTMPPESRIQALNSINPSSKNSWYFIHEKQIDGKGYFAGYENETKRCIGFIARKGMSADLPPNEEWFPFDGRRMMPQFNNPSDSALMPHVSQQNYNSYRESSRFYRNIGVDQGFDTVTGSLVPKSEAFMISGDQVLEINFEKGTVKPFLQASNLESGGVLLCEATEIASAGPAKGWGLYFWVFRSSDRLYLLDETKKQVGEFVIPQEFRKGNIGISRVADDPKQLILGTYKKRNGIYHHDLNWIDTEGKILRHEEITLVQDAQPKPEKKQKCDWESACACPAPAGVLLTQLVSPVEYTSETDEEIEFSYSENLRNYFRLSWPAFLLVCAISALLTCICYRRQRRYALPFTWVWVAFVFLCGVPGYLAYRFHRRWAVLDECPACKKKVPRDREACSACGKSFPPPELKGIEVFV